MNFCKVEGPCKSGRDVEVHLRAKWYLLFESLLVRTGRVLACWFVSMTKNSCRLLEIVVGTCFLCGCVFLGDFFHTVSCSVWRCRFLTRLGTRNSGLPSFGAWGRENFSRPKNLNTRHHHRQPRQLPATPASPPPGNSRDLPLWPPTAPNSTLAAPPAVLVVVGGGCVNGRDGCNQTAINH